MVRPTSRPARRALSALALSAVLGACGGVAEEPLTGAGASSTPTASSEPSSEPTTETPGEPEPAGPVVEVVVADGRATPLGERVPVAVGETVTFEVRSDAADEIHVHSSPEETFAFGPGRSTFELTLDRPGLVEVELHELGSTLVQLEVR